MRLSDILFKMEKRMNTLKLITAAAMLTTVIPSGSAMMNMSGFPEQMKVMFKSSGFTDTSSAEYKSKKAKQQLENAQDCVYHDVIATLKEEIITKANSEELLKWYDSYTDKLWTLVKNGNYTKVSAYDEQKVWIETTSSDAVLQFGDKKLEIVNEQETLYAQYNTEYISGFKDKLKEVLVSTVNEAYKEKNELEQQKRKFLNKVNNWLKDNKEREEIMKIMNQVYQNAEYVKIKLQDPTKACVNTQHPKSLDERMTIYYSDVEYISDKLFEELVEGMSKIKE